MPFDMFEEQYFRDLYRFYGGEVWSPGHLLLFSSSSLFTFLLQISIKLDKSGHVDENTKGADRNIKSGDRQGHGHLNETNDKHRTHTTTLKTKAGVTRTLPKPDLVQVLRKFKQLMLHSSFT